MTELNRESPIEQGQGSDYDGAWKEALRSRLNEFIGRCFPTLAELIDWTYEPEWLDKEISQIIGQSRRRNREVDLLFKVRLIDGRDQWILCHLEIQTSFEADFAFRIDLYNAGLKWLFRQDVLTLVILADLNPDWRPSEYHFELAGFGSDLRFPICKILDHVETDWVNDTSLVPQVARAQIAALRTANDPEARFYAKTQIVRNLYTSGHTADTIREAFRLIDWMMHLRLELSQRFEAELIAYEKERQMPYVTSVELIAEERGLEKGLEQGTAAALVRILTRKFNELPTDILHGIHRLTLKQSQELCDALLDFRSAEELRNWLTSKSDNRC